jgi:hypothetical protein
MGTAANPSFPGDAEAADSCDPGRVRWIGLDFAAQPLDVHVECLGVPDIVITPDPVDERLAWQHPPGVRKQEVEQLELLERQCEGFAVHRHMVLGRVECDTIDVDSIRPEPRRVLDSRGATQKRSDSSHQLADPVRLGHVVVGADLEPDDRVDLCALRRHHDDRHLASFAELAAHVNPADLRQHHIEQHKVGSDVVETGERLGAVDG